MLCDDLLLRRSWARTWRAGPSHLGYRAGLAGSNREFPRVTVGSGTKRARAYCGEHLIRRHRQVVQDRLLPSVRWADIPQLSTQDWRCLAAWQQYWQQWSRGELRRQREPVWGPLHVELVTLRVEHGDAVLAVVRAGSDKCDARRGQLFDRLIDAYARAMTRESVAINVGRGAGTTRLGGKFRSKVPTGTWTCSRPTTHAPAEG